MISKTASSFHILDIKGKPLIAKYYRDDVPKSCIQDFVKNIIKSGEEKPPVYQNDDGYSFVYIKHNNLFMVIIGKYNLNAMMLLKYLHAIKKVFTEYFNQLEEESIKDNFVVVYELLDEMMDYGYPQSTDGPMLKEFIKIKSHKLQIDPKSLVTSVGTLNVEGISNLVKINFSTIVKQFKNENSGDNSNKITIPKEFTNATGYRPPNIHYDKNQLYLDVVEELNMVVSKEGRPITSKIEGFLTMRAQLSGTPNVRLGLNDKVLFENMGHGGKKSIELEDVKFHQCVKLNKFEQSRSINFVPPDGEFELMRYRLNSKIKPLILVSCKTKRHGTSRIEYIVKAKGQFKAVHFAHSIEIRVPVPDVCDTPKFRQNSGSCEYKPKDNCIVWHITKFHGRDNLQMRAEMGLPTMTKHSEDEEEEEDSVAKADKQPLSLKFTINQNPLSGLKVKYLKASEPKLNYPYNSFVRYFIRSGDFLFRR